MAEIKVLTEHYHLPEYQTLAGYKAKGGYETLPKALKMQPQAIIDEVKASGLRGRGGGIDRDHAFFLNREIVEFLHGHVVVVRHVRVLGCGVGRAGGLRRSGRGRAAAKRCGNRAHHRQREKER